MTTEFISSDTTILDLLRKQQSMTVSELSAAMGVTATAVRQRLGRLTGQGLVERAVMPQRRGRPSHGYSLTAAGRRKSGANFADLALALWHEVRQIDDQEVRRGLLQRIARRLAESYAAQVEGGDQSQKMESLAEIFRSRDIPFEVSEREGLPVLNALACPYPDLAEQDRSICAMERMMVAGLVGERVRLSRCRLDGDSCCTFEPAGRAGAG